MRSAMTGPRTPGANPWRGGSSRNSKKSAKGPLEREFVSSSVAVTVPKPELIGARADQARTRRKPECDVEDARRPEHAQKTGPEQKASCVLRYAQDLNQVQESQCPNL